VYRFKSTSVRHDFAVTGVEKYDWITWGFVNYLLVLKDFYTLLYVIWCQEITLKIVLCVRTGCR
jgi:hypothetical protein